MFMRKLCAVSVAALVVGCTQTVDNPAQSPSYVAATLGYDAYKQGDLQGAETQFESALSTEPDNPYALLGLGAVRENSGDLDGAERLYTAARQVGFEAQANYTYITEQRLEKATNQDVASLAVENLARLNAKRAALQAPVPATTGFASYDGGTAVVMEDTVVVANDDVESIPTFGMVSEESYTVAAQEDLPVVEAYAAVQPVETYAVEAITSYDAAPVEVYDLPSTESYDVASGGDYETVGSYETYTAGLGGGSGAVYADAAPMPSSLSYETVQAASYGTFEPMIEPASYGTALDVTPPMVEPAIYEGDLPAYDAPLPYDVMTMAEPVPTVEPISTDYASATPVYAPVSTLRAPLASGPAMGGPAGVLAYGDPLGSPVDLLAATRTAAPQGLSGSPAVNVTDKGGLIFLDDG